MTSKPDNIPRYLYRFVRFDHLWDIIIFNRLYVPRRIQLNDPFDGVVKLVSRKKRKEKQIQKQVDKRMRILSFSGDDSAPTNPLMWSHYADGHKGVCLQFDMELWRPEDIDRSGYVLGPVRYSQVRPLVNLPGTIARPGSAFGLDPRGTTEPLNYIAFTKHKDWCYEQEWRIICSQKDDKEAIYLSFPPEALVEVITGLRMPEQQRKDINNLIEKCNHPALVAEAREDGKAFQIIISK